MSETFYLPILYLVNVNDESDDDPEENSSSPFVILNLLRRNQADKNVYEKTAPKFSDVDKLAVLYLIYMNRTQSDCMLFCYVIKIM